MSAHTQGRLVVGQYLVEEISRHSAFHGVSVKNETFPIAVTGPTEAKDALLAAADARRLAACWNACEGVPTDTIEQVMVNTGPLLANKLHEADQLRALVGDLNRVAAQQVELVASLRAEVEGVRAALAAARGERDDLRTELAASVQRNDDMIAHGQAKALELAEAMALLAEVHSFATGAPTPIGSAGCHTLSQLGERVGLFLKGGAQ